MRRRITVTGPVDVATAWTRYVEIRRWSDWAPQIRGVEASGERLVDGLTGRVRAPLGVAVPFVVDRVDEAAHRWRWTVSVLGVAVTMGHDLTATSGGTRAGLTIDAPAPFALTYGLPARVALRRLCRHACPATSRTPDAVSARRILGQRASGSLKCVRVR